MTWAKPANSHSKVDAAGHELIQTDHDLTLTELNAALIVINNWRSSHAFPLNTFQNNLRAKTKKLAGRGFVAQRIKRLPAIRHKLERTGMRLSGMQDIGGCRAVVATVPRVRELRDLIVNSHIKHELIREDDYIEQPKEDGYRSIHLVYRYRSDKDHDYDNLKIELQLRTRLQHAWATAVETVGEFRKEMLKSDQGDVDWLRFFELMGSVIAKRERCRPVPNTPATKVAMVAELRDLARSLDVVAELRKFQTAMVIAPDFVKHESLKKAHFFLLELDSQARSVSVTGYRREDVEEASRAYQEREVANIGSGADVVLVSADTIAAVRRAYPNYFVDTTRFLDEVVRAIR